VSASDRHDGLVALLLTRSLGSSWTIRAQRSDPTGPSGPSTEPAPTAWTCILDGGDTSGPGVAQRPITPRIRAWIEDGWLQFDLAVTGSGAYPIDENERAMLAQRMRCGTAAKLVLDGDDRIRVRAELPIAFGRFSDSGDDTPTTQRLRETVGGMLCLAGLDLVAIGWADCSGDVHAMTRAQATDPAPPEARLSALCAEAGWPCSPRAHGSVVIELPVAGAFCQAVLASAPRVGADQGVHLHEVVEGDGSVVRVACTLEAETGSSTTTKRAVELLMLRTNGSVRMVRGNLIDDRPVLECWLGVEPTASELAQALCAMTMAARCCAREADALLRSPMLASTYLATLDCEHYDQANSSEHPDRVAT